MGNNAYVTGGKPIAAWSQSISGVSVFNSFTTSIEKRVIIILFYAGYHMRLETIISKNFWHLFLYCIDRGDQKVKSIRRWRLFKIMQLFDHE
jgi:hypothetical protein